MLVCQQAQMMRIQARATMRLAGAVQSGLVALHGEHASHPTDSQELSRRYADGRRPNQTRACSQQRSTPILVNSEET